MIASTRGIIADLAESAVDFERIGTADKDLNIFKK